MVGSDRQVFKKPALAVVRDMMALIGIGFNPFFKPGFAAGINLQSQATQLQRPVTIRSRLQKKIEPVVAEIYLTLAKSGQMGVVRDSIHVVSVFCF